MSRVYLANSGYRTELPADSEFVWLQNQFPVGTTVRHRKEDDTFEDGTVEKLNGCAAYVKFDFSGKEWTCLTELEAK